MRKRCGGASFFFSLRFFLSPPRRVGLDLHIKHHHLCLFSALRSPSYFLAYGRSIAVTRARAYYVVENSIGAEEARVVCFA